VLELVLRFPMADLRNRGGFTPACPSVCKVARSLVVAMVVISKQCGFRFIAPFLPHGVAIQIEPRYKAVRSRNLIYAKILIVELV
jgi:hypothetical protein